MAYLSQYIPLLIGAGLLLAIKYGYGAVRKILVPADRENLDLRVEQSRQPIRMVLFGLGGMPVILVILTLVNQLSSSLSIWLTVLSSFGGLMLIAMLLGRAPEGGNSPRPPRSRRY